jgi:N-acetylneuraminate synthase/N,N'-diacetyllegionaminate synthase
MKIASTQVGEGRPAFLIAEIGINHNGDLELARASIDAAARAGADAVKFQNYRTEDFLSDRSLALTYRSGGQEVTESQYELFKRCELSDEHLTALARHAWNAGVLFLSTPTSPAGVDALVRLGAPALKNGSDFLGNLPLIAHMARTGLPTMLSTGMAELAEIEAAVGAFRAAGGRELIVLHCVSSYPTPPREVHLRKMTTLQEKFGCLVGFSDHTEGTRAACLAVTLGAAVIEKHFTLDRSLAGPDHWFSSDPVEFAALVKAVHETETMLGSRVIRPTAAEADGRALFRLSCAASAELPAGHVVTAADIKFLRPGTGVPAAEMGSLLGRTLGRPMRAGELFAETSFAHAA